MGVKVACVGECMVELRERPDGSLSRGYGGDTLNTAVYLARLGVDVDYVTALGDDAWSDAMVAGWHQERVGTTHVHRIPGRLPGLYIIQTDARGERRFSYWRDSAAARLLLDHVDVDALSGFDVIYLSGITLSIFAPTAQDALFATLEAAHRRGGRIVFDTNYRPRGWPDPSVARTLYGRMFAIAQLVFASVEDLALLFGPEGEAELRQLDADTEIVIKAERPACRVLHEGRDIVVEARPVARVVDTTAAGDSFAAAYLAARIRGAAPEEAARAGHELAGVVVAHAGALVPRDVMAAVRTTNA